MSRPSRNRVVAPRPNRSYSNNNNNNNNYYEPDQEFEEEEFEEPEDLDDFELDEEEFEPCEPGADGEIVEEFEELEACPPNTAGAISILDSSGGRRYRRRVRRMMGMGYRRRRRGGAMIGGKRRLSAYNMFMKRHLRSYRAQHGLSNKAAFTRLAHMWKSNRGAPVGGVRVGGRRRRMRGGRIRSSYY